MAPRFLMLGVIWKENPRVQGSPGEDFRLDLPASALVWSKGVFEKKAAFVLSLYNGWMMTNSKWKIALVTLLLGVFFALLAVNGYRYSTPNRPNILIIGVDTLRADHLGCYGYFRDTSPAIDRLASQGTLFENCFAPIPRTTQSIASLMTARYPQHHGVRNLRDPLPEEEITLAEILQSFGYRTLAVQSNSAVEGLIDQGYDRVVSGKFTENKVAYYTADIVNTIAFDLLGETRKKKAPFFLWVFYFEPHMPYAPKEKFFDAQYEGRFRDRISYEDGQLEHRHNNRMTEVEKKHVEALYDSEIRTVDRQVQLLIDHVEKNYPDTIIIFTADHGENFGERNYYFDHGLVLDQAALRVPLIIKGMDFGTDRVKKVVRLIDVMPTILSHLNIVATGNRFDGVDLLAHVKDQTSHLKAFAETGEVHHQEALDAGLLYLRGISGRPRSVFYKNQNALHIPMEKGVRRELYDFLQDPRQETDLFEQNQSSPLFGWLADWVNDPASKQQNRQLSEKDKERLRALGYL